MGHPVAFVCAILTVIVWALTGPLFHFDNAWQLVINTGTTIVTFLMVFAIQNAQNRDAKAVQLKLDELIRALATANNNFIAYEKRQGGEKILLLDDPAFAEGPPLTGEAIVQPGPPPSAP
jgi:low affinity Fe/Cu permease